MEEVKWKMEPNAFALLHLLQNILQIKQTRIHVPDEQRYEQSSEDEHPWADL